MKKGSSLIATFAVFLLACAFGVAVLAGNPQAPKSSKVKAASPPPPAAKMSKAEQPQAVVADTSYDAGTITRPVAGCDFDSDCPDGYLCDPDLYECVEEGELE